MGQPINMKYWSALIVNKQRRSTKSENGHGINEKCVCNPVLVTTFPEWLSGTEPWPRTHGAVRRSSSCLYCVCVHMYSFAGLIRRTPPPTFSDTAITDCHSDITIFQLRAHWVRISWSAGSEKSFRHVPPVGVETSTPCVNGEYPIH